MRESSSEDLHSRLIAAVDGGLSWRAAPNGLAWARPLRSVRFTRWRDMDAISAKPQGGDRKSPRVECYRKVILAAIERRRKARRSKWPRCSAPNMVQASQGARSGGFSTRHAMTFRKKGKRERARLDVAAWRQAWFDAQPDLDPEHLVVIDETGASTKMARLCGRAQRGKPYRRPIPHGHWKTTTFTGALRLSAMTAPMVLDGSKTGNATSPTSSRSWHQRCGAVTSRSAKSSSRTKALPRTTPLRQQARRCCSSRIFARLQPVASAFSSSTSFCARLPHRLSLTYAMRSAMPCRASPRTTALTTSMAPS